MGQITIDIPQRMEFNFRVVENETANEVLASVRNLIERANAIDFDPIPGIWSDRDESAGEIAASLRRSWRRKLYNG